LCASCYRARLLCPSTDVAALMPGNHTLCSVNYKVAVSMARLRMEDSNRALRDRALYKPAPPTPARSSSPPPPLPPTRWPRKRKNKKKKKKQKAKVTPVQGGEDDALATHPRTVHIGRKYRRDRPWLSARELRDRAREDIRERCDQTPPMFSASDACAQWQASHWHAVLTVCDRLASQAAAHKALLRRVVRRPAQHRQAPHAHHRERAQRPEQLLDAP
jgi:hypothetical protein